MPGAILSLNNDQGCLSPEIAINDRMIESIKQIPSDIWMPLIVAFLTTAVIAPLVGLYIKPWVEARKQRLIRDREQIDEVIFKFQKVSLCIGALTPDDQVKTSIQTRHNAIMIEQAQESVYQLIDILSRLSHRYVRKHSEHIGKTVLFLGYLLTLLDDASSSTKGVHRANRIIETGSHLSDFDVYFLANVGLKDSQEKWFRRLYWNKIEKKNAEKLIMLTLKKYNLSGTKLKK